MRLKTLGDEYTEQSLTSRILWNDDMGDSLLHNDIPEPSDIQRIYISAIERLHILITEGKKIQRPLNANLPYLPNNDRDVQIVSAQLAVINRDNIQSIGELESRMKHLKTDYYRKAIYNAHFTGLKARFMKLCLKYRLSLLIALLNKVGI